MKAHSTKHSSLNKLALLAVGALLLVLIDVPFVALHLGLLHTPILVVVLGLELWFGVPVMRADLQQRYPEGEPRAPAWRLTILTLILVAAFAWLVLAIRFSLSPGF